MIRRWVMMGSRCRIGGRSGKDRELSVEVAHTLEWDWKELAYRPELGRAEWCVFITDEKGFYHNTS